jgi:Tfp pilus assembly protein PilX
MTYPDKPTNWRGQDGVTLIVVLAIMLVTSMLVVAGFTAANGEIHLTKTDRSQKKAYYAAEAGVEDYEYHLTQDGNYLSYCTNPPAANPALNQVGENNIHRATVPNAGEGSEPTNEQYAIQLLPAESDKLPGDHKCDPNHLVETMLEEQGSSTGTFRIESTGYAEGQERSIVATFRNANFVSYVWYTKFETGDPSVHGSVPTGEPATYWTECGQFYGERPAHCSALNNYFGTGESVNGPMHTEDHVGFSCKPVFGRVASDRIEFRHSYEGDEGYSSEGQSCGSEKPTFLGTHIPPSEVPSIEPPPGDEELKRIVEPAYLYEGKTEIVLEGSLMTVVKHKGAGGSAEVTEHNVPFPANGVIYVSGACAFAYSPFGPAPTYSADTACGNVYVHGNYASSLTIASENDIVINGNVTTPTSGGVPTSNAMLGLIANNFVRVYHPVALTYTKPAGGCQKNTYVDSSGESHVVTDAVNSAGECVYTNTVIHGTSGGEADACDAPNAPISTSPSDATPGDDMKEPVIDAAILALKHSFIVDNFDCGAAELGHLNVFGAIAGLYTDGLTGVISGTTIEHGYGYNLQYDNRLQVEEPPHFLNPIQAAWYIQRQSVVPN